MEVKTIDIKIARLIAPEKEGEEWGAGVERGSSQVRVEENARGGSRERIANKRDEPSYGCVAIRACLKI